jgi:hypothetical protein
MWCLGFCRPHPAIGEALAGWIVTGQPSRDLHAFRLARFGAAFDDEQALQAACLRSYADRFTAAHGMR